MRLQTIFAAIALIPSIALCQAQLTAPTPPSTSITDSGTAATSSSLPMTAGVNAAGTATLNLATLLNNPLAGRPELQWLEERRAWAARNARGPDAVEQV